LKASILNFRTIDSKKVLLTIASSLTAAVCSFSSSAQVTVSKLDSTESAYQKEFSDEFHSLWKNRNRFLGLATLGQKFSVEGKFQESNAFLEKAFTLESDYLITHSRKLTECYEDDHDLFMVLYFKTLNYLSLNQPEEALVECRRMDELLAQGHSSQGIRLVDSDPLVHVIMGLTFEINGEYDNSAISYKRAKSLFEKEYRGSASKEVPFQLDYDLQKVAALADQAGKSHRDGSFGELIFIWHNGGAPRKINLDTNFKIKCRGGELFGTNSTLMPGEDFIGNKILPFYKYSNPNFWSGTLVANGHDTKCELLEDATWYSIRALQDRLASDGIHLWHRGEDWSTLPQSIYYVRVPLSKGKNYFDLIIHGYGGAVKTHSFSCEGNGKTYFHFFTSLENHDSNH
jgi:hypothetical protein